MPKPLPPEVRQFVDSTRWTFAKTYARTWPHEYVVRSPENEEMLLALARHIFEHGVDGRFYHQVRPYHHEDGKVYWSMDDTVESTTLINRCDESQTYEARLVAGTLPGAVQSASKASAADPAPGHGTVNPATISEFSAFATQAEALISRGPAQERLDCFRAFAGAAPPAMTAHIRERLLEHRDELAELYRWTVPEEAEVLSHAGLGREEQPCTRLVGWMLHPGDRPQLALRCQQHWLRSLGLGRLADEITRPATPKLEVSTDVDRVDLVLHYEQPDYLVLVEAKIDSAEHETPGGEAQTKSYPRTVRKSLGLEDDHPTSMVFLTTDGRRPVAADAIAATFDGLVRAVVGALNGLTLPEPLRWAYAAAITHLLHHATEEASGTVAVLRALQHWFSTNESPTDEHILGHITTLGPLARGLARRTPR